MKKTLLLFISLIAGLLIAQAQVNISLHKKYMQESTNFEYTNFETNKLPTTKKAKSAGQDWWEPDTVYTFTKEINLNVPEIGRKIIEYEYNSKGLPAVLKFEQTQRFENNFWKNDWIITNNYDSYNNLIRSLHQFWQNNSWVDNLQLIYSYDSNNNMLEEKYQNWKNNAWVNSTLLTYTYDSNNNMITCLRKMWYNNSWENSSLITYTYDSNNNLLTELFQRYRNSSWEDYRLDTYTYDQNNNMLTYLVQEMQNNSWKNSALFTYTYDSNNNMTNQLLQRLSSLDNYEESRMFYDENNNGISAEFYSWINDSWQPLSYSMFSSVPLRQNFYYNNMQSVYNISSCYNVTASYIKVSDVSGKEEIKTASPIQIFSSGKTIHINNQSGKNGVVTIYRIDGVKVAEQTMVSQTTTLEIPVSGFYLVSVKAGNEKPVMEKVIIR